MAAIIFGVTAAAMLSALAFPDSGDAISKQTTPPPVIQAAAPLERSGLCRATVGPSQPVRPSGTTNLDSNPELNLNAPVASSKPLAARSDCQRPKEMHAGEVIANFDQLSYRGYMIQTHHRLARVDGPPAPEPVKVSYVVVKRNGRTVAKFDSEIYSSLGNSTEVGLYSLLNNGKKQLILSQDSFKTGVQWVADFSPGFRIIFDGMKFHVGREGDDMTISDLDGDGVSEITVPITAFYGFERWRLSTSDTPLPDVVFKYDAAKREYLPANPLFKQILLRDIKRAEDDARAVDQQTRLGSVMSVVLHYIFAGEEGRGWKFFEETCSLPDKGTIRADMEKELKAHPVYRYLQRRMTFAK